MPSANGNGDSNAVSSSSTAESTTTPSGAGGASRPKKHSMLIPGMPPVGISSSGPLIGTPYAFSHASPFEYPFPSPTSASAPTAHMPLYIPSLDIPSRSPFPFAPALLSRGNGHLFGHGGVHSLGLGPPMWKRSSSPPHPKFALSRADPPVPPRLKEKVQNIASASADDSQEKNMRGRLDEDVSRGNVSNEPAMASEKEDVTERSRPGSPDVT